MPQCNSHNKNNSPLTSVPNAANFAFGTPNAPKPSAQFGLAHVENRLALYKAAKVVHRSPAYVMSFINAGLLKAYRRGGPVNNPWLAVDLSELLAVIDRETLYVPPGSEGRRPPKPRINKSELHPLAAAL